MTAGPPEPPGTAAGEQRPARIFLYGSCVSRDSFQTLPESGWELAGYVARQSLISAGQDASQHLPAQAASPQDLGLEHEFQARMVRGDWAGDLWERLEAAAQEGVDLLVWDLVDERHGVYVYLDGGVVTRSVDLLGSETLMERVPQDQLIGFGGSMHLEGWRERAADFAARLRELGLWERTVVLRVPWAATTAEGEEVPSSRGLSARRANELYAPYYAALEDLGFNLLSVPEPVLADAGHRWGLAPFHYAPEVYDRITAGWAHRLGR